VDFFTPIIPVDRQHPNFRTMAHPSFGDAEKQVLQQWAQGFVDRDGKLVKEFQTTFNSTFWELYLNAAFRDLGFLADFSHTRPDFVLSGPAEIVAEATIAGQPAGYLPEWEREYSMKAMKEMDAATIVELASIRLSNAIDGKQRKYLSDYSKLPHVSGKPFVICVAPFEQPFFFFQNDHAIRRVLYGYDEPLYVDLKSTGERVIVGDSLVDKVRKETGTDINLGVFTRPGLEHVSAVIFSVTATVGKLRALAKGGHPLVFFTAYRYAADARHHRVIVGQRPMYHETLLDGLHVLLNPYAYHALDPRIFDRKDISIHTFDPTNGEYLVRAEDGFLFYRDVKTIFITDDVSSVDVGRKGQSNFHTFKPTVWPEGELVSVGGEIWPATDNYMAHYHGWTIVIYRDTVDNDWGGQAVEATCKELASFRRFNAKEDARSVFQSEFFPTREKAFEHLKGLVDEAIKTTESLPSQSEDVDPSNQPAKKRKAKRKKAKKPRGRSTKPKKPSRRKNAKNRRKRS
jgi:hypothetical protein